MSEGKFRNSSYYVEERPYGACVGNFVLLKNYLAKKDKPIWIPLQLLDALFRGYGQVILCNNPISGLLVVITLASIAPKVLAFSAATGFLGLLISMLLRSPQYMIESGLAMVNPILIGSVSCGLIPQLYGEFDAFCYLLILIATIISVYLTRSLESDKFPCTTWPFNLVELLLLYTLTMQDRSGELLTARAMDNATSDARTNDAASFIAGNVTDVNVDWGMVFHGMVVAPGQLFCMSNVAMGAVIYLAVLIYSPTTAGFSFAGVFIGTLAALGLGAPYNEVVMGFWGFNCYLTAAALGGTLFVLNVQTAAATLVAVVYTVAFQYLLESLFMKIGLPFLSLPFLFSTYLFLPLRTTSLNSVFPAPLHPSYPEKQRQDYLLAKRQNVTDNVDSEEDPMPA